MAELTQRLEDHSLQIARQRAAWTAEEDDILRECYPTTEAAELAQRLGRSTWAVIIRANRLGIRKDCDWLRSYHVRQCEDKRIDFFRQDYFSQPLTPDSAYWLGFIQADGSIDLYGGANALKVQLAECDIAHLRLLKNDLGTSREILKGNPGQVVLKVNSRKMISDLLKLGIMPRKAFTHTYPKITEPQLVSHYIRGIFDGDGCIAVRRRKGVYDPIFNIAGGKDFCKWALEIIRQHAGIRGGGISKDPNSDKTWHIQICGYQQVKRVYMWLYFGATRWLARKREKFELMYEGVG